MSVSNPDIADVLEETANLMRIEGADSFRVRAYRNAARAIRECPFSVDDLARSGGDLRTIPSVGAGIAARIREIVATGTTEDLTHLRERLPQGLAELLRVPGLGAARVKELYDALGVGTIDDLRQAIATGRLATVRGYGEKTIARIAKGLEDLAREPRRTLIWDAARYVDAITAVLGDVVAAGSFRRGRETVRNLNLVARADDPSEVIERFATLPQAARVLVREARWAVIALGGGLEAELRVAPAASFGAALAYFTGSEAHVEALREAAEARDLRFDDEGVFRGGDRVAGDTEESVYKALGLPWIPPELREGRGEIEAARKGRLPRLLEAGDLRGDLHSHTRASDGRNTLDEMAAAAQSRGLEYLAITEHSPSLQIAGGLTPDEMRAHLDAIDALNRRLDGFTLLKGIEVDILEDGSLDMTDDVLARLDVVVASVHSKFGLPRAQQTERIMRAMDHPRFMILGHPSGRLIGRRAAYDVDMERIIRHARDRGRFMELDGQPDRLDLSDEHCRIARDAGVMVSVDSDAHSVLELEFARGGVRQARRGWLERKDVLNARPLGELRALLERRA